MAAEAACLALEDITHVYNGVKVLREVSIHAREGEILCLLGRSGCGKTTLLRLIAGLERPTHGRVALKGADLTGPAVFVPPEKRGIGFMFQDYALFPHLTVLENALFGLKRPTAADTAHVKELLARVGLEAHADRYPHTLSAGEQQRAALIRALAPRPAILLMDEPFSNLDARTRDAVRDMTIALLRETRTPAVIVTHDPAEALRIGDRIVLMHAGRVVQTGSPQEIYKHPADIYAARYFSDLNEIDGTCRQGAVATALGTFNSPGLPNGPALACLRPQDLTVSTTGEGLPGRVCVTAFLGDSTQLTLQADIIPSFLRAIITGTASFAPGQDVRLTFAPDRLLFFPKHTSS